MLLNPLIWWRFNFVIPASCKCEGVSSTGKNLMLENFKILIRVLKFNVFQYAKRVFRYKLLKCVVNFKAVRREIMGNISYILLNLEATFAFFPPTLKKTPRIWQCCLFWLVLYYMTFILGNSSFNLERYTLHSVRNTSYILLTHDVLIDFSFLFLLKSLPESVNDICFDSHLLTLI